MATYEEIKALKEKIKTEGLMISRVPEPTRTRFIEFSNGEFAGDYGMALVWYIQQANEYQKVKRILLNEEIIKEILKNDKENL